MKKVLITTVPFADKDTLPLDLLDSAGIEYLINPLGRKLKEDELAEMVRDYDALIAGTEIISEKVMRSAKRLKFISRVGIGLDSVDLTTAKKMGIKVSYTPDAPSPAVSELTIGIMLSLLRHTHLSNLQMHKGEWHRYFGRRLSEVTIGIIGVGRIGKGVIDRLQSLSPQKIYLNDLDRKDVSVQNVEWVNKDSIYRNADIISLHLPLTAKTKNLITLDEIFMMKKDAILINTSRGGIINESDLGIALREGHLSAAAVDTFEMEPYEGELTQIDNCLLTAHMGSMSIDCRTKMEIEATEEAIRFFQNQPLKGVVPIEEYEVQKQGL